MRGHKPPDQHIDAGLAVISVVSPKGYCWTFEQQAYVCGCSRERIRQIYCRAIRKCRIRLTKILQEEREQAELAHRKT